MPRVLASVQGGLWMPQGVALVLARPWLVMKSYTLENHSIILAFFFFLAALLLFPKPSNDHNEVYWAIRFNRCHWMPRNFLCSSLPASACILAFHALPISGRALALDPGIQGAPTHALLWHNMKEGSK